MYKKRIIMFLMIVLGALGLISCGKELEAEEAVKETAVYKKIVVLDPAVVEMLYLLNAEDRIAAVAHSQTTGIWPEDKTKDLPDVGTLAKPSLEKIISFSPDLVVLSIHSTGLAKDLEAHGIKTVSFPANSFDDIFNNFLEVGKLIGKEDEAQKITAEKKEKLEEIKKSEPLNKKGAFIYSASPMMAFGENSLPGEVLKIYGVENLTDKVKGERPILTPEYVIEENPDFLLVGLGVSSEDEIVTANPQLKDTNAVKNKNIIKVNSQALLRGSPRIVDETMNLYEEIKNLK
ncbi:ABC transporter substrate-binding protein [Sebaldella termitidis]|uniref:ABC transporter substrate-binding protein n=1 Tax=Sebaldella termitidis TaxID=826 RepID=UPI003EB785B4